MTHATDHSHLYDDTPSEREEREAVMAGVHTYPDLDIFLHMDEEIAYENAAYRSLGGF